MGKRKTKTKQRTAPTFQNEILGAYRRQQDAYGRQAPKIGEVANRSIDIGNSILDDYEAGDPTIEAAQGYVQDTLALSPDDNPYLDDMIAQTNSSLLEQIRTQMGTRGNLGGSVELGILGDALSDNELSLRYQDYDRLMGRQAQAAGLAPSITSARYIPVQAGLAASNSGALLPLQAANANSATISGLLGQYTDTEGETKQSGGLLGSILAAGAAGLSGNPRIFG